MRHLHHNSECVCVCVCVCVCLRERERERVRENDPPNTSPKFPFGNWSLFVIKKTLSNKWKNVWSEVVCIKRKNLSSKFLQQITTFLSLFFSVLTSDILATFLLLLATHKPIFTLNHLHPRLKFKTNYQLLLKTEILNMV